MLMENLNSIGQTLRIYKCNRTYCERLQNRERAICFGLWTSEFFRSLSQKRPHCVFLLTLYFFCFTVSLVIKQKNQNEVISILLYLEIMRWKILNVFKNFYTIAKWVYFSKDGNRAWTTGFTSHKQYYITQTILIVFLQ